MEDTCEPSAFQGATARGDIRRSCGTSLEIHNAEWRNFNPHKRAIIMSNAEKNKPIRSREDFITFVRALSKDFRDNPQSWENDNLERFLEALGAWVEDMDGYYLNQGNTVPQQLDWKTLADMLMAAKKYE
jgi:hypothetical protein